MPDCIVIDLNAMLIAFVYLFAGGESFWLRKFLFEGVIFVFH